MSDTSAKWALWEAFCVQHRIAERAVPLFAQDDGVVRTVRWGRDQREILSRSALMELTITQAAAEFISEETDSNVQADGILYMMFWSESEQVQPLYIGKAGRIGKKGGLSANLRKLDTDKSKFGRWGSNYAYHIGDLSAVVCGHPVERRNPKYSAWAARLFDAPTERRLRRPVWFWATAWGPQSVSIWSDYSPCGLAFQEYLLIGVASDLFPHTLLNREGVNAQPAV